MVLPPVYTLSCYNRNILDRIGWQNVLLLMVSWSCCIEETDKSGNRSEFPRKRKTLEHCGKMSIKRHSSIQTGACKTTEELDSVVRRPQSHSVCWLLTDGKNTPMSTSPGGSVEVAICAGNQAANKSQIHPVTKNISVPPRRRCCWRITNVFKRPFVWERLCSFTILLHGQVSLQS